MHRGSSHPTAGTLLGGVRLQQKEEIARGGYDDTDRGEEGEIPSANMELFARPTTRFSRLLNHHEGQQRGSQTPPCDSGAKAYMPLRRGRKKHFCRHITRHSHL